MRRVHSSRSPRSPASLTSSPASTPRATAPKARFSLYWRSITPSAAVGECQGYRVGFLPLLAPKPERRVNQRQASSSASRSDLRGVEGSDGAGTTVARQVTASDTQSKNCRGRV